EGHVRQARPLLSLGIITKKMRVNPVSTATPGGIHRHGCMPVFAAYDVNPLVNHDRRCMIAARWDRRSFAPLLAFQDGERGRSGAGTANWHDEMIIGARFSVFDRA